VTADATPPTGGPDGQPEPAGDDLLVVVAHSLLSSVAVLVGGTELLRSHWRELADDQRTELLTSMHTQATHVAGALDNLLRLGAPRLVEALDELRGVAFEPPG
jgi:K+-sensing histidine kinase KdpD